MLTQPVSMTPLMTPTTLTEEREFRLLRSEDLKESVATAIPATGWDTIIYKYGSKDFLASALDICDL